MKSILHDNNIVKVINSKTFCQQQERTHFLKDYH